MKEENPKTELTTKEWLQRAYLIDEQIKSAEEQIERWNCIATKCSQNYGQISKGGGSKDIYKYYACIADARKELEEKLYTLVKTKTEISNAINRVSDPTLRLLLEYRYILFNKWEDIAEKLKYSIQHVKQILHPKALKEITRKNIIRNSI